MYISDFIFEVFKVVFPILISLLLFYFSNKKAKQANREATNANCLAKKALKASEEANDIAREHLNHIVKETKRTQEENYNKGRPQIDLKSIWFDTDEVDIYVGSNVLDWGAAKAIDGAEYGHDFTKIVKSPDRLLMNTRLPHNGKQYMFLNLLPPNIKDLKDVILVFGALKLVIDIGDENTIKEFKIEKSYSMKSEDEHFGNGLKINFRYPKPKHPLLEIPIAYACVNGTDISMHLGNIYYHWRKSKLSGTRTSFNLLEEEFRHLADTFISFIETGYVIKCTTYHPEEYEYTIFLEKKDGKLCEHVIEDTADLFNTLVAGKEHIVQHAID